MGIEEMPEWLGAVIGLPTEDRVVPASWDLGAAWLGFQLPAE
ncbi:hypothetical protein [Kitasatospora fiedleri]|nr:hypothetical protein [Kitasatospora fiedleri]